MTRANNEIRNHAKAKKVMLWQVATALGISESAMTRMLRQELQGEKKLEILSVIDRLSKEV